MPLFKRRQRISFNREMAGHPLFLWTRILSSLFIVLSIALILWKLAPMAEGGRLVALHYNVLFGVDLLGAWYQALALPGIGLVIFVANMLFARQVWEKEHLLSLLFAAGTIVAELTLFVAVVFITLLNL